MDCKACIEHNSKQPTKWHATVRSLLNGIDDDFDLKKMIQKRPHGNSYVGCSQTSIKLHQKAVAAALKRQKQLQDMREHVSSAKQMSTAEKTRLFFVALQAPSLGASAALNTAVAPDTAAAPVKAAAPANAAASANVADITTTPVNAAVQQTKQKADGDLWLGEKRNAGTGCDHWQRVKPRFFSSKDAAVALTPKGPGAISSLSALDSPLPTAPSIGLPAFGADKLRQENRANFKEPAAIEKAIIDAAANAKAAAFIAAGGVFNSEGPGKEPTADEGHAAHSTHTISSVGLCVIVREKEAREEEEEEKEAGQEKSQKKQEKEDTGQSARQWQEATATKGHRHKASASDADAVVWTHGTLSTFLDTVVAHNPFEKCLGTGRKIGEKWHAVAVEMAEATRDLEKNAVVTTADALRVKFARIKVQCKNYREGSRAQRQSGLGATQDNLAELAEHMDACLNLQKNAEHNKEEKKKATIQKQKHTDGAVEPAGIKMASGAMIVQGVNIIIQGTKGFRNDCSNCCTTKTKNWGNNRRTGRKATFVTLLCILNYLVLFQA
jgi:hypothetical protein